MKYLTYILTLLIYFQSFALYAFEGKVNCHKVEKLNAGKLNAGKENQLYKKTNKHHCCSSNKENQKSSKTDKDCCGDMCKCQHLNHNHILSLLPISSVCLSPNISTFIENIKFNKNNLHGFDPINSILQPPRL